MTIRKSIRVHFCNSMVSGGALGFSNAQGQTHKKVAAHDEIFIEPKVQINRL